MAKPKHHATVIVVEGLPGAGKTTLAKMLERDGWTLFPEVATETAVAQIAVADSHDPGLDPFIMCEEARREERAKMSSSNRVLLESSHLANLAWAKARADLFGTPGYDLYLRYYQVARAKRRTLQISAYMLLDIGPRLSNEREGKVGLRDEEFLSSVSKNLFSLHKKLEPTVPLHVIDATQSATTTYKNARIILDSLK